MGSGNLPVLTISVDESCSNSELTFLRVFVFIDFFVLT